MALSDFLQEQANAAIQQARAKSEEQRMYEREKTNAKTNRYLENAESAVEMLKIEIAEAEEKAAKIIDSPMPSTVAEFKKKILECDKKIKQPLKECKAATLMMGAEETEDTPDIDFERPSEIIRDAWKERRKALMDYAQETWEEDEEYKTFVQGRRNKVIKKVGIIVGIVLVVVSAIVWLIISETRKQERWDAEYASYIENKNYEAAISMLDALDVIGLDEKYEAIADKMAEDGLYKDALKLIIKEDMGLGSNMVHKKMTGYARIYKETHSNKQTKEFIRTTVPMDYEYYDYVVKCVCEDLQIK